jgi:mono/diheme cytochrome c family protein
MSRHDLKRDKADHKRDRTLMIVALGAALFAMSVFVTPLAQSASKVPAEFQPGEGTFNNFCARCHGAEGSGTKQGPPLVHKIYEPNHHGDAAFQRAAANGVRAHHWQFGDMPKIDGVKPEEVDQIVKYVRWLQRQAGIM